MYIIQGDQGDQGAPGIGRSDADAAKDV
jgi:hypothetical protein